MTTDDVRKMVYTMSSGIVTPTASTIISSDDLSPNAVREAMNGLMRAMAPSLLWSVEQTPNGDVRISTHNVGMHDTGAQS